MKLYQTEEKEEESKKRKAGENKKNRAFVSDQKQPARTEQSDMEGIARGVGLCLSRAQAHLGGERKLVMVVVKEKEIADSRCSENR